MAEPLGAVKVWLIELSPLVDVLEPAWAEWLPECATELIEVAAPEVVQPENVPVSNPPLTMPPDVGVGVGVGVLVGVGVGVPPPVTVTCEISHWFVSFDQVDCMAYVPLPIVTLAEAPWP